MRTVLKTCSDENPIYVKKIGEERLYSNPIRSSVSKYTERVRTFVPKGDIPYCVRFSKDDWVPVNTLVFSDTPANAITEVEESLLWQVDMYYVESAYEEPDTRYFDSRLEYRQGIRDFLAEAKREVQEVTKDQLFKIGWADNDTFL